MMIRLAAPKLSRTQLVLLPTAFTLGVTALSLSLFAFTHVKNTTTTTTTTPSTAPPHHHGATGALVPPIVASAAALHHILALCVLHAIRLWRHQRADQALARKWHASASALVSLLALTSGTTSLALLLVLRASEDASKQPWWAAGIASACLTVVLSFVLAAAALEAWHSLKEGAAGFSDSELAVVHSQQRSSCLVVVEQKCTNLSSPWIGRISFSRDRCHSNATAATVAGAPVQHQQQQQQRVDDRWANHHQHYLQQQQNPKYALASKDSFYSVAKIGP